MGGYALGRAVEATLDKRIGRGRAKASYMVNDQASGCSLRSKEDGLAALLPFLVADGCELVVTLGGYFDESERQERSEPIAVAGFIFRPGNYKSFARDWHKFLKRWRLTHLHMTDLYAGQSEYKNLGDRRGPLFGEAVGLINKYAMAGIAVMFLQKEFEKLAPPWYAQHQGSIYATACQICLRATTVWLDKNECRQFVAYTFESGHRFQAEANALMKRIGQVLPERHRYQSHSFADKKSSAGLQAADLLAWTAAKASGGFTSNRTLRLLAPYYHRLLEDQEKYQTAFITGASLRQFFAEQRHKPEGYTFKRPPEARQRLR